MADLQADALSSASVEAVIVRACTKCHGPRTIDEPCAACGNKRPPEVTRLGVVSATHKRWWRRLWWTAVQKPLADRRIQRAGRRSAELTPGLQPGIRPE